MPWRRASPVAARQGELARRVAERLMRADAASTACLGRRRWGGAAPRDRELGDGTRAQGGLTHPSAAAPRSGGEIAAQERNGIICGMSASRNAEPYDPCIGRIVCGIGSKAIVMVDSGKLIVDLLGKAPQRHPEMGTLVASDALAPGRAAVRPCADQPMAPMGHEFAGDLACRSRRDARRMLGGPGPLPQHRMGEQRRILGHRRALPN
jgi:hypothetical protein